jgi:hypothetical protein
LRGLERKKTAKKTEVKTLSSQNSSGVKPSSTVKTEIGPILNILKEQIEQIAQASIKEEIKPQEIDINLPDQ